MKLLLVICILMIIWALKNVVKNIKYNKLIKKYNNTRDKYVYLVDNNGDKDEIEKYQKEFSELEAKLTLMDNNL